MPLNNIRVPPDSTGKRVLTHKSLELNYNSGTTPFTMGDQVVGLTSGASGVVSRIEGTTASGTIWLVFGNDDDSQTDFISSEALQVDAVTFAFAVSSGIEAHVQKVVLTGGNNQFYEQKVDVEGAAYIRFSEGHQLFDAFGLSKVSQSTSISKYTHIYNDLDGTGSNEIFTQTTGTASKTHNSDSSTVTLQVGTGATDAIVRTGNRYNVYTPGSGQLTELSCAIGDSGKANVFRRWGYYDDNDGCFFSLEGTTLYVVIRSSVSGSVVETKVAQEDWSNDTLDGSLDVLNSSGFNIDVSKANLYWIDFQWLGVGQVRFGVYSDKGERVVAHIFGNPNANTLPYMSTGTLPVRWEMYNTGVSGSISEMTSICAVVLREGHTEFSFIDNYNLISDYIGGVTVSTTEIPIMSIRPALTFEGKTVRAPIIPDDISYYTDQPVVLRIRKNTTLTGPSWGAAGGFSEADTSATAISGGDIVYSEIINDAGTLDTSRYFSYTNEYLALDASGVQSNIYTVTAERIGAVDATLSITGQWKEGAI